MKEKKEIEKKDYRDSIATVDASGSRIWIYPKKPKGWYYNIRSYVSYGLLILLFGLPFVKVNGGPLFLFNILERQFILFGFVFTPQDFFLFALAVITLMLFIVLFTVVFGRLFCGWVCPQTIFMEMVFRKIEYLIEGDANQQKKLNKAPWTGTKIWKKSLKHFLFFSIAILIANTFLSYIIGVDNVMKIISEPVSMHFGGFSAMLVFSGLFYGVFAFFREQVCIAVCPYGRLQGVLLVKNSIVVMYDWLRGEPRGKKKRKKKSAEFIELPVVEAVPKQGDCIDCNLCVQVCPTGIDIRNGTQLECVNCTACIDACDEVMIKIGRPTGLIRYDSLGNIESGEKKIWSPRVIGYAAVLLALIIFQSFLFYNRSDISTSILRTPGMLYQEVDENHISNLYNYQILNKSNKQLVNLELRSSGDIGKIKLIGHMADIDKFESIKGSFFIEVNLSKLKKRNTEIEIDVLADGEVVDHVETSFLGPVK